MIGSHNSLTYMEPRFWVFKLFKRYWKCQMYDLREQYEAGARFFDIRVRCNKRKQAWVPCHGIVDLKGPLFPSIDDIHVFMESYPDAIYRIFLERGDKYDEVAFSWQCFALADRHPNFLCAGVKKSGNWMGFYRNEELEAKYPFLSYEPWTEPNRELHGFIRWDKGKPWYRNIIDILGTNLFKEAWHINKSLNLMNAFPMSKPLLFIDFV